MRVYLVGGDPAPAQALADMLSGAGFEVAGVAPDIPAARALLPRLPRRPDAVVIDLDKPRPAEPAEASGILDSAGEPPPLVFLSDPADVSACRRLAAGPGIPLFRPVAPPALISAVEKAARMGGTFLPPAPAEAPPVSPVELEDFRFFEGRQELLFAMFEATPDLVVVKDGAGVYRAANPAFCRFLWRDRDGILGKTDFDLFPREQARRFRREDERLFETGLPLVEDQEIMGPRGLQWLSVTKTPVREAGGPVVGVFVSARDISRRKGYERTLNQRLRYEQGLSACYRSLLSDSDAALKAGLENLLEAAMADRVFLFKNGSDEAGHAIARLAAEVWAPAQQGEKPETANRLIRYDAGFQRWQSAFADNRPVLGTISGFPPAERAFFSAHRTRSVLLLPVYAETAPYGFLGFEDAGNFRRWDAGEVMLLKTAADMIGAFEARRNMRTALEAERSLLSDRVGERTRELEMANRELARAARLKDEFLANMSHELRTPLTAVLGMAEALQDQVYGPLNEKQLRGLETIERSGAHLLALINDILDISKIEAGKLELEILPVSAGEICDASLRMVRGPAEKKGITLHSRLAENVETISADQRRLKQVLVNLLSNAVKFTPEGGVVTLAVEARSEPARILFRVRDTGIGIGPEAREHIFEPFTQLDGGFARSQEGTGLGLALVRRLVRLHGGEISLESQPGEGSTFTVSMPQLV